MSVRNASHSHMQSQRYILQTGIEEQLILRTIIPFAVLEIYISTAIDKMILHI